jgi:hypothetical protein
MSDYRKLLTTPCRSCVIDVVGWREPENTEWPQRGWINIGLISNHDLQQFNTWRSKFRRILAVWHGETYPFLEFYCREDVDAFSMALREAADAVLPSNQ